MNPPTIPVELQEHILGDLRDDIPTLKSCAFVCRAWRPTTRSLLFRRFRVLYQHGEEQGDSAFQVCGKYVDEVLYLAEYIRELEIQDEARLLMEDGLEGLLESKALCTLLDRTHSLQRVLVSTFRGGLTPMRAWRRNNSNFRVSFTAALRRSQSSLTHVLFDGFSFAASDFRLFHGMRCLQYVGLERMTTDSDEDETLSPLSKEEPPHGSRLQTLTLYFSFADSGNGPLVVGVLDALHSVNVAHITNLRLGGVVNAGVFEALPASWLSCVTHLGLELTNLNPTHASSPLAAAFVAKVPTFRALKTLELSLNIYPSAVPHDLSALEGFMARLLPANDLASIVTTVTAHGPPVYLDALRRHYHFCLSRAEVVKVQWEDGKPETLEPVFPALFADGTMTVGKFRQATWISW
ncbi:hypothetical protein C8R46DRAFT_1117639 [Mycena filopes]|nr:hypothetical protein C8R46DRAFT_1117639 [Mycena filopes]